MIFWILPNLKNSSPSLHHLLGTESSIIHSIMHTQIVMKKWELFAKTVVFIPTHYLEVQIIIYIKFIFHYPQISFPFFPPFIWIQYWHTRTRAVGVYDCTTALFTMLIFTVSVAKRTGTKGSSVHWPNRYVHFSSTGVTFWSHIFYWITMWIPIWLSFYFGIILLLW